MRLNLIYWDFIFCDITMNIYYIIILYQWTDMFQLNFMIYVYKKVVQIVLC